VEFLGRVPPEFAVLTVRDALTKVPELANTRAVIDWFSKNALV